MDPAMPHVDGVEHRYAVVAGLRMHYAEAGDPAPVAGGLTRPPAPPAPLVPGRARHTRSGPAVGQAPRLPDPDPAQVTQVGQLEQRGARALRGAAAPPRVLERVRAVLPIIP